MHILDRTLSRREVLRGLSAAAVVGAHDSLFAGRRRWVQPEPAPSKPAPPLIRSIRLLTAADFGAMREFYRDKLGFAVVDAQENELSFAAGMTRLTFIKAPGAENPATAPFYHFAFNIPQNKLLAARKWQLERSSLVPTPPQLRDPAYPDDVRHFRSWNAHSLFFFDPAFNILEYIARHDLKNDAPDPDRFSTAEIQYASEIGYMVHDQAKAARALNKVFGLPAYPKATDAWWSMGDERGLLLCLPIGRVFAQETATPKTFAVFSTEATVSRGCVPAAGAPAVYELEGYPYKVRVE